MRIVVRPFNTNGDPLDLEELLPDAEAETLEDGTLEFQLEDADEIFELLASIGSTCAIEALDEDFGGFGERTLSVVPTAG